MGADDASENIAEGQADAMRQPKRPRLPDYDLILSRLLAVMTRFAAGFDITPLIDGQYVSGSPISIEQYFEEMGKFFTEVPSNAPTAATMFGETFVRLGTELRDRRDQDGEEDESAHKNELMVIHLKNAVISINGVLVEVPVWRGRLSMVSAWFPGRLGSGG